jgi:hypothetical protein
MRWLRSLAAELFPAWHDRRLLRRLRTQNEAGLAALKQLALAMNDKAENVRAPVKPGLPGPNRDANNKGTVEPPGAPKTRRVPPRDTHDWPSKNPNGDPKGKVTPQPTD